MTYSIKTCWPAPGEKLLPNASPEEGSLDKRIGMEGPGSIICWSVCDQCRLAVSCRSGMSNGVCVDHALSQAGSFPHHSAETSTVSRRSHAYVSLRAAGGGCSAGRDRDAAADEPSPVQSWRHERRLARAGIPLRSTPKLLHAVVLRLVAVPTCDRRRSTSTGVPVHRCSVCVSPCLISRWSAQ